MLVHWINSRQIDMSLHSDTFSWFRVNFHLSAVFLAEKQQIPIYSFLFDQIVTHYTTAVVFLNIRITQWTKCIALYKRLWYGVFYYRLFNTWVIVFIYHVNNNSYINLKEEMRGIPGKYANVKVIYLGRGINHIDRTACCLGVEKWSHGVWLSYKNSLTA